MNPQQVLDLVQESFKVGLLLSMPIMMAALVVGVIVSVLQAVTSVQEQSMVFVPKMIAVAVAAVVFFSWMMGKVMTFTTQLINSIPQLIN